MKLRPASNYGYREEQVLEKKLNTMASLTQCLKNSKANTLTLGDQCSSNAIHKRMWEQQIYKGREPGTSFEHIL